MSKQWNWRVTAPLLAAILLTGNGARGQAGAGSFSGLVVFGDSHSDTGNLLRISSRVWVEELAGQLGLPAPASSNSGGSGHAWGGARTGFGFDMVAGFEIPRLGEQIKEYLASQSAHENKLFALLGGHNDFGLGAQSAPSIPVSNISSHITTLAPSRG